MKKVLPILALLLVLAVVVFFTRRRSGGGGESFPASRAAELAPAETVFYFEMPDLPRTVQRWGRSELPAIAREPGWQNAEWQSVLAKWMETLALDEGNALLLALHAELGSMEPSGIFLATTDFDPGPWPKAVGGIACRAKKSEVEAAVRRLKARLLQKWPGAVSEISDHGGMQIESITSAPSSEDADPFTAFDGTTYPRRLVPAGAAARPAIHLAFRDDWFFFATERELLEDVLDRYLHKPGAPPELARNAGFAECRTHDLADADLRLWARAEGARCRMAFSWLPSALPALIPRGNPLAALHFAWSLEGPVRERLYFQAQHPPASASPGPAFAEARALGELSLDAIRGQASQLANDYSEFKLNPRWLVSGPGDNPIWREQFGDPSALPDAPLETRFDEERFEERQLWEALAIPESIPEAWDLREFDYDFFGNAFHKSPEWLQRPPLDSQYGQPLRPAPFLLWPTGIEPPALAASASYQAARRLLGAGAGAFCRFDPARLFLSRPKTWENYQAILPFEGDYTSLGLSRFAESRNAIQKHLKPGEIRFCTTGHGWLIEGTLGPVEMGLVKMWMEDWEW